MLSRIPGLDKIVRAGVAARTHLGLGTGDSPVFAGLDVNGGELVLDADGDTSITADSDDQIDIKIAGADDFQMTANTLSVLSGSTLNIDSGATIANSGTATGFGSGLASGDVIPADDGSVGAPGLSFADDTDNGLYRIGADNFGVAVAGALAMEFDPIGAVQMPLQPCVLVEGSVDTDVTGDGTQITLPWGTEVTDQNNDFDPTTETFTAPVTGMYQVECLIYVNGIVSGHTHHNLGIVATNRSYSNRNATYGGMADGTGALYLHTSALVDMDAADTVLMKLMISGGTKVIDIPYTSDNKFSVLLAI